MYAADWRVRTLGECAAWLSGGTPRKSRPEYWGGSIPWISAKSLDSFFIADSDDRVTPLGAENGTRLVPENTVLFIVRGMSLKTEFRMGITVRPVTFNQDLKALVARDGVDPKFLAYAVKSMTPTILGLVDEAGHGTGRLATDLLQALEVPTPPLDEQRRIAGVLGALDDKIELNRRMNRTLEGMAKALFKSWFIDFDGHDDLVDSEIGPVPRGWEVGPLDEIIEVIGGGTPKRSEPSYWRGGVPWFSVQDAPSLSDVFVLNTKEHITEAGLAGSSARLVPAGTTIISARGTVGKLAVTGQPMAFNQSCYGIAPSRGYTGEFIYFLMRSVVAHLQRSAHGSVFDTITRSTFQTVVVPQPPVERTRAFATTTGPLLKRIAVNSRESLTLAALRDTLLPKLISGELRVPEAEALLESAP